MNLDASPEERLELVLAAAGFAARDSPVRVESNSNDAWLFGDCVLRICWRGDRARLRREALIGEALPAEVRYPQVLAHGEAGRFPWLVTRRVEGTALAAAWPLMSSSQRDRAGEQLAAILRALHEWAPPAAVASELSNDGAQAAGELPELTGRAINPLPVDRALRIAGRLRGRQNLDSGLLDAAATLIEGLRELDPFRGERLAGIAHCDLHLWNVLWNGRKISALLDLEWARLAPPDLDLDVLLRISEYDLRPEEPDGPEPFLFGQLHSHYPELFAHPNLVRRLWLYALAGSIREIAVWPTPGPERGLERDHPVAQLRRLVAGPHVIEKVLDRVAT